MRKRVLLKISGEALKGDQEFGICSKVLDDLALQIKQCLNQELELSIVIGGGNIWRGKSAEKLGMERTQADYIGMLATVMNGLALSDKLRQLGVKTCVLSALKINDAVEPYFRQKAIAHLEHKKVCIFVGGTGSPYFSTDTACALRACEIKADCILMAKNNVDGVYDSDPKINKNAKLFKELSFNRILELNLQVMDQTAATLCKENDIDVVVFNINKQGNILRCINQEDIGTLVSNKVK